MNMYLISDNVDTLIGMRLAGVDGCVIHDGETLQTELGNVVKARDLGIVLITERLSKQFPDIIADIKLNHTMPLIVEIPDRHGGRTPDFITAYIRDAIGIKL